MSELDKRFLLRIWSAPASAMTNTDDVAPHDGVGAASPRGVHGDRGQVRASLRDVEDGRLRTFADLDSLVRFLSAATGGAEGEA